MEPMTEDNTMNFQDSTIQNNCEKQVIFSQNAAKSSMRYDAVYHLTDVRKFTKQHLLRVVYFNNNKEMITANALKLEFSSSSHNALQANRFEIRYVFIDGDQYHAVHRSDVLLRNNSYVSISDITVIRCHREHLCRPVSVSVVSLLY